MPIGDYSDPELYCSQLNPNLPEGCENDSVSETEIALRLSRAQIKPTVGEAYYGNNTTNIQLKLSVNMNVEFSDALTILDKQTVDVSVYDEVLAIPDRVGFILMVMFCEMMKSV